MSLPEKSAISVGNGFETTRWTVIRACAGTEAVAHTALSDLCRIYWQPVYAYVRNQGQPHHDAQDLVQQFFEDFLSAKETWASRVDQEQGRFRAYLLTCLRNFLRSESTRRRALKRGGQVQIVPWETLSPAEQSPAIHLSGVDLRYDRAWAVALTDAALKQLEGEFIAQGKVHVFNLIRPYLTQEAEPATQDVATILGLSVNALQVLIHRTRRQYGVHLRGQVALTVCCEEVVEEELRYLRRVMFNAE